MSNPVVVIPLSQTKPSSAVGAGLRRRSPVATQLGASEESDAESARTGLNYAESSVPHEDHDHEVHLSVSKLVKNTLLFRGMRAIIMHPASGVMDASLALMANHEMSFFSILFPSVFTIMYHPESFTRNRLLTRHGYNDLCVMFDTKPAVYFALMLYIPTAYFAFLHVHFKLARLFKSEEQHLIDMSRSWRTFIIFSDILFLFGTMLFVVTMHVSPDQDVYWHTIPFVVSMWGRLLTHLGSYVEYAHRTGRDRQQLPDHTKTFMFLVSMSTIVTPIFWFMNYAAFDNLCDEFVNELVANGTPLLTAEDECVAAKGWTPLVPAFLTGSFDYLWFVTLPLTPLFLPHNPVPMTSVMQLTPWEESHRMQVKMLDIDTLK